MEQGIQQKLNNYFNTVLKNSLGYPENFDVKANINRGEISLTANQNSGLINMLYKDEKLRKKLRDTLLSAFRSQNADIQSLDIKVNGNVIMLYYGRGLSSTSEINLRANIAAHFDSKQLTSICLTDKSFQKVCTDELFWIELFKNKFGEIPEWFVEGWDYKTFYINILKFMEDGIFPENRDSLRYIIENKRFKIKETSLNPLVVRLMEDEEPDDFDDNIMLSVIKNHSIYHHLIETLLESIINSKSPTNNLTETEKELIKESINLLKNNIIKDINAIIYNIVLNTWKGHKLFEEYADKNTLNLVNDEIRKVYPDFDIYKLINSKIDEIYH